MAVLADPASAASASFAGELVAEFHRALPEIELRVAQDASDVAGARWVVLVGGTALRQWLLLPKPRPPALATLVPRAVVDGLGALPDDLTLLYLDQPEVRQLSLIRLLPGAPGRVGLLVDPSFARSPGLLRWREAAGRAGVQLRVVEVPSVDSLSDALQTLLADVDVVLALPDPRVFNSLTIQSILLTTYRARLPLVGFSEAYTRAGALVSLQATPKQLVREARAMLQEALRTGRLPTARFATEFDVSINRQVARSLGLNMPTEHALAEALRTGTGAPGAAR